MILKQQISYPYSNNSLFLLLLSSLLIFFHPYSVNANSGFANRFTDPNYIRPWPVSIALGTGVPKAVIGTCQAGAVYTIKSVKDLVNNITDLQCIYVAGKAPSVIPTGPHYGTVLKFSTTDTFTPIIAPLWKGKFSFEARCPTPIAMGLNVVNNRLQIAALLSIEIPDLALAEGEYSDGQPTMVIDYTRDFGSICQSPSGSVYGRDYLDLGIINNVFPFNQVIDAVRVVGRQADGGLIYLGKSYLRDPYRSNRQGFNIAYWSIVNYDSRVANLPEPGESLPPLAHTFSYSEPGLFQIPRLLNPSKNFLVDPATTVERFFEYFDSFAAVIQRSFVSDVERTVSRTRKIFSSHLDYLIGSCSAILSQNPSLTSGLSAESVVDSLLLQGSQEVTAVEDGESLRKGAMKDSYGFGDRLVTNILRLKSYSSTLRQEPQLKGASSKEEKEAVWLNDDDGVLSSSLTALLQLSQEIRSAITVESKRMQALDEDACKEGNCYQSP